MTDPTSRRAKAEADAALARQELMTTLSVLRARVQAKVVARNAAEVVAAKAQDGVDAAKRNPAVVTGVLATATLWLARHRIAALFRRRRATADDTTSLPKKPKRD